MQATPKGIPILKSEGKRSSFLCHSLAGIDAGPAVMALGGKFAGHGVQAELAGLGAFAAVDAGVLAPFGHDDPHGSLAAKQAEHAAHRAEVVAPDPPDEEEFGQENDPNERQFQPHSPLVDETGGLDRDDPWGRGDWLGGTRRAGWPPESRPAPHSEPAKQDPG